MSDFCIRRSFGKNNNSVESSNLIGIQKSSYLAFLQADVAPAKRKVEGLQAIFKEVLNLSDPNAKNHIEFLSYSVDAPEHSEEECIRKDLTYSSAVKVKLRIIRYEGKSSEKVVKEIKEQEVFFADIPLMTDNGAFIINGSYRVIVSQLHKSAGVFFDVENFKNQGLKKIYSSHIVPYRGAWLDFEIDQKNICWVRIDKKRKLLLTTFLMLVNLETTSEVFAKRDILRAFYDVVRYKNTKNGWEFDFKREMWAGVRANSDIYDVSGNLVVKSGSKITSRKLQEMESLQKLYLKRESLVESFVANEIVFNNEVVLGLGAEITDESLATLDALDEIECLDIDHMRVGSYLRDTLITDKNNTLEDALHSFYKIMRPGEVSSFEGAISLFKSMFFDFDRYDLSIVGRIKMNARLKKWYPEGYESESRTLKKEDFVALIKGLLAVKDQRENVDDIDHLGFRRVRSVGELVANQCRMAMFKVAKSLKERLNMIEAEEDVDLHDLVNSKMLGAAIREFFGTSQLSQIIDNINALAEVSHKRRVTAMGPGGLDSLRATFEVRDVHSTHYGRICAVETPEGQNIGLINYLAMHARIDEYGFIQTPYRKVVNGQIQNEVVYLNAQEEENHAIASCAVRTDKKGNILDEVASCRKNGDYFILPTSEIEYIDVASGQILSVAASLIPFIENDDPGRALMGSNMQRQALPVKVPEAPFVGTGVEKQIGIDSMTVMLAHHAGKVIQLDSSKIVIQRSDEADKIDTYKLKKFQRSNAYSCINQRPIVTCGDIVQAGQIIADGSTTDQGEISLGKNLRIAFMAYKGYTFEDAIVVSSKLLNDTLTSVRVEELDISIKEGEDLTRAIPSVSDEFLRSLDETGIVYLGAKVKAGDILVGRVSPKAESPSSPEERLLKAMFGEKADNVIDASLRVPPGCNGTVVDVQVFSKKGLEKDERTLLIERIEMKKMSKARDLEIENVSGNYRRVLQDLLDGEIIGEENDIFPSGIELNKEILADIGIDDLFAVNLENAEKMKEILRIKSELKLAKKHIIEKFEKSVKAMQAGDDLPPGIMKHIKIFIAMSRVIEPGDKVAGRHGNKGVISKVLPVEDMPFDDDGQPVDMILNPLGIAARMNIGQILETHLGWVSSEIGKQVSKLLGEIYNSTKNIDDLKLMLKKIYPDNEDIDSLDTDKAIDVALKVSKGMKFAVPSFDGARIEDLKNLLRDWGLNETGKIMLRDGATGEYFQQPIAVGYMYIAKLNHMVADKIHARSTGSYSLVTQQPPGGRAKMGGQRKGEMEIWALEAYGAAYITRESMTVKSDDHAGRVAAYEAITQGYEVTNENYYTPEAFKILQSEMRCIGINLEGVTKNITAEGEKEWLPSYNNGKFDALRITLLSPDQIKKASFGEIQRAETINYRTQKAEIGGLHCPAIFGPEKDYRCSCGRYSKMKYRGIVCEKCGVEVTLARVRRERMGHIELASPVAHIWFSKILPSRIGMMLGVSSKDLDKVLRFERYIVAKPGITPLERCQLMTTEEYNAAKKEYGAEAFVAMMGAEGVEAVLKTINLEEERLKLEAELGQKPQDLRRKKLIKKLKLVEGFIATKARPEWMILRILPVMPADLRPLVALDAGRFATSDVNELYRKVLNRNNRLKELADNFFPEIVIRNEKRMLQNSVDALIDNSRLDKPFVGANGRPLQSIGDTLKGKQGRFRQNLLGKRVDYSGRSVIVVGPNLKLHQCGLPKKMALELFKPFVFARLEQYGYATTLRSAKRIVEEQRPEVWEILREVVYQHPVLLNRPPTLHRLGIQAFECVLIDSNAIELHPLVCAAFNADFDGDQMSVHVPLSVEAQIEARVLMMPTNNMISPANGKPVVTPKKDMVLGLYYLTHLRKGLKGEGMYLNQHEIDKALFENVVDLNAEVNILVSCPVDGDHIVKTTPGRVVLFNHFPKSHKVPFKMINKLIAGKDTVDIFSAIYETSAMKDCVAFADTFMRLGFKFATISGISCSYSDIIIPESKKGIIDSTWMAINEFKRQYNEGLITEGERRNQVTDAWYQCDERLGKDMEKALSAQIPGRPMNSLYMMYHSGARGSTTQMRQIMSIRGFIAKTDGEILENAVDRNYAEGLDSHSYYLATHGTRKGFSDMALKTADAGYFTRKLVDVAQDCIITSNDCQNRVNLSAENMRGVLQGFDSNYITFDAATADGRFDFTLALGRVLAQDVFNPENGEILLTNGTLLRQKDIESLTEHSVLSIKIRSPITCANEFGICAKCYGMDLSKSKLVSIGEPVGVIAAQSIGEPGAQLTMRTFHSGGGAKHTASDAFIKASCDGEVHFRNAKFATKADGTIIMLSRYSECKIIDEFGRERVHQRIPYGAKIMVKEGQKVQRDTLICEWDPYIIPRLAHIDATVYYSDLIEGISLRQIIDESTGSASRIVNDWKKGSKKSNLVPAIVFRNDKGEAILGEDGMPMIYRLDIDDVIMVNDGDKVKLGDVVIKKQKKLAVSGDITSGLPRLVELFEARLPKMQAVISEVDGVVASGKDYRFKRCIVVIPDDGTEPREYMISKDLNILVQPGDPIRKGDPICDGDISSHDILKVLGTESVVLHLLKSVQNIFNVQGIVVDNKHVECIVRYMMRKVEIMAEGDSEYVLGEQLEYIDFISTVKECVAQGKVAPRALPVLLGITRAASMDSSFIKAASFQEAHKVFVQASLSGQIDELRGMKQRLITGQLIPAGTGFVATEWEKEFYQKHPMQVLKRVEEPVLVEEIAEAASAVIDIEIAEEAVQESGAE